MSEMKDREALIKAAQSYQSTCERVERLASQHKELRETARVKAIVAMMSDDSVSDGRATENAVVNFSPDYLAGRSV